MEAAFINRIRNRTGFRLYLLRHLPAAFFAGVRIESVTETKCTASVPFRWATQNPFRSTYFACLSMAAEMSTGVLAMAAVYKRRPAVSILVTEVQSQYFKKAVSKTLFTCMDGTLLQQAVAAAIESGTAQTVKVYSEGLDASGNKIAAFWITWSFKTKKS